MKFEVSHIDGAARRGELTTAHGVVQTPIFMPCGTYGSVKGMLPSSLDDVGVQILLGNTFHLMLRPGVEVIEGHGGLHGFMGWQGPILTDSGGFQVFSLGDLRKISEEGVKFRSPVNGDAVFLSPEISMQIQAGLNADIVMVFDECTPFPAEIRGHKLARRLHALCERGPALPQDRRPNRVRTNGHEPVVSRRILAGAR